MDTKRQNTAQTEVEIDLVKLMFAYLNRWWLFLGIGALGCIIAAVISLFFMTPMYESSISIFVNNRMDRSETDYVSSSDVTTSRNLVSTYLTISKSDRMMESVALKLENKYSYNYLKSTITAAQQGTTELFTITVKTDDPAKSALIANTIGEVLPEVMADIVEGSSARVIDYAKVASKPSSPNNVRNAIIGLLIGLVLAAGIATIEFLTDVRIKEEEDITSVCEYPILGQIPDFATIADNKSKKS